MDMNSTTFHTYQDKDTAFGSYKAKKLLEEKNILRPDFTKDE